MGIAEFRIKRERWGASIYGYDRLPAKVLSNEKLVAFLKRSIAKHFRAGLVSDALRTLFLYFLRVNRYIWCSLCPGSTTYGLTRGLWWKVHRAEFAGPDPEKTKALIRRLDCSQPLQCSPFSQHP
jgi:hypothetical protein